MSILKFNANNMRFILLLRICVEKERNMASIIMTIMNASQHIVMRAFRDVIARIYTNASDAHKMILFACVSNKLDPL